MNVVHRAARVVRAGRPGRDRRTASALFDRLTERARDAVALASDEARRWGHHSIGTEHLLVGILQRPDSVGARILSGVGLKVDAVRAEIERDIGRGPGGTGPDLRMTPRLKQVVDLAVRAAKREQVDYVGTEHLLLGLLLEGGGVASRILANQQITPDLVRAEIVRIVGQRPAA